MAFPFWICCHYLLITAIIVSVCSESYGQEKQITGIFVLMKKGYRLKSSVYESVYALDQMTCAFHCAGEEKNCQSFNFKTAGRKSTRELSDSKLNCELNSQTASSPDEANLEKNVGVDYYEKIKTDKDLPAITTCSTLKKTDPEKPSGFYIIKPSQDEDPFTVFCNMTYKNGVGVTVFSHDSEEKTLVDGYESPGSYKKVIHYNGVSMKQIEALINVSSHCEQFVKFDCYNAGFYFNLSFDSWWVSRQGKIMKYWGGAEPGSGKCACGMTNSCIDPSRPCNCDGSDNVWSEDSGFLKEMSALPVKELRFGDTGHWSERGYHTVGKFVCWG